ncbi:MAG TPA: class I SAM-dependent methyltransferase [Myxococcota bacterium]
MTADTSAPDRPQSHHAFYDDARAYDVAFGYRDVAFELDFIVDAASRCLGHRPTSAIELASGPGAHATALAQRGVKTLALDLSAPMIQRVHDNAKRLGVDVTGIVGDMADFVLPQRVELAFNLLTSISYLLTTEQLHGHFRSVSDALVDGGCYVVENNHPNDFWTREHFKPSRWTEKQVLDDDGDGPVELEVSTSWVDDEPVIDVVKQTYTVKATTKVTERRRGEAHTRELVDHATLRMIWPQELKALGEAWGLDVVGFYGALDAALAIDAPGAWRTVVVFKKRPR